VKNVFDRWLPAIEQMSIRNVALTVAGVLFVGGLAASPANTAGPAPLTPTVNPAAAAALRQAVSADTAAGKPVVTVTDAPATVPSGGVAEQPESRPAEAEPAAAPADDANPTASSPVDDAKPAMDQLIPHGTQGAQSSIALSKEQMANAKAIVHVAKKMGLPDRAAVIGVATALQESKLNNYGHLGALNDHDSQGLFQQRPSAGWGSPEQITDPDYAATVFYQGLMRVNGWQDMPLTDAAQAVQVSAFPYAYAQWELQAAQIVQDLHHSR
jgi:hypothetical protein